MNDADLFDAIERHMVGETVSDIARSIGVTHAELRARMRQAGYSVHRRQFIDSGISEECLEEAKRLHQSGERLQDISRSLGIKDSSDLSEALRASGYSPMRMRSKSRRARLDAIDIDEVHRRNRNGESLTDIGRDLGVKPDVLSFRLRRAGYSIACNSRNYRRER